MTDDSINGGLHIDGDWKAEAAREKQRLVEQEQTEKAKAAVGKEGEPTAFLELVNVFAMQAAISLGGYQSPTGESVPADLDAAKHHIDLLEVLQTKTKGNLTEDEDRVLGSVLHELRMQYVHAVTPQVPPAQRGEAAVPPTGAAPEASAK